MSRKPCSFFQKGRCKSGSSCRFAHVGTPSRSNQKKSCVYFQRGECKRGESCHFLHIGTKKVTSPRSTDTATTVCVFFKKGNCNKGTDCAFSHDLSQEPCFYYNNERLFGDPQGCDKDDCTYSHKDISTEEFYTFFTTLRNKNKTSGGTEEDEEESARTKAINARLLALEKSLQDAEKQALDANLKNLQLTKQVESMESENKTPAMDKIYKTWKIETVAEVKQFVGSAHCGHQVHHVNSVLRILRSDMAYTPSANEIIGFHATSAEAAMKIQDGSFIPSSGGMLGAGIYVSPTPEKAWGYRKGGVSTMLLCLVNIAGAKTRGSGAGKEYCVDSPSKVRPLYVLVFK